MSVDLTVAREKTLSPSVAERRFSQSMIVSGIRCMLAYGVFPFALPVLGFADSVGPVLGVVIGVVAIVFNGLSIRRFWRANHRLKWPVITVNIAVIVLLCYLMIGDLAELI
ncbi:MAG: hypothetical protein F4138_07930 [Acidimicrobiia bacterium]|nr:hypothetical protein [Acidimicrobiia bacterium]MYC57598.1 hypothetical protein [Acidimicrobiia bacterium]MYG94888.1 hypothetical protein [Acidimicrobiia bacterium]MYI31271.1 hypothetical protein [Acidimicrobiia bacterium]